MKKRILLILSFVLLLFLFLQPSEAVSAAKNGLLLWFNVIIPNLFPFIILSNLIILLHATNVLTFFISPLFEKTLGIHKSGSYAILLGFLCGYPMGAKVCADLVKERQLSQTEGQYLLLFCNNVSPVFILNYIIHESLKNTVSLLPVFVILYLSPILVALLFNPWYRKKAKDTKIVLQAENQKNQKIDFDIVDKAITNAFESITKLGGYIILFAILSRCIYLLPFPSFFPKSFFVGLTEITYGISMISQSNLSKTLQLLCILTATSFGGLSSIAQTQSMIKDSGLSILLYTGAKLITMLLTYISCSCYLFWL